MDISKFDIIEPGKGGKKTPTFTLLRSSSIRANGRFIDKHNLKDKQYVLIKGKDEGDKVIIAFKFTEEKEENSLSLFWFRDKEKKDRYSFSFSARGIISKYNLDLRKIIKNRSLRFEPTIKEYEGEEYFIIEIDK